MKVYILWCYDYSEETYETLGVFDSREKAIEFREENMYNLDRSYYAYGIEEFEVQ